MSECAVFIPGRPGPPDGPLARYRPTQAGQAIDAYLGEFTKPGDLVLDLFCQDSAVIRAAVAAGRRALGISAILPLISNRRNRKERLLVIKIFRI